MLWSSEVFYFLSFVTGKAEFIMDEKSCSPHWKAYQHKAGTGTASMRHKAENIPLLAQLYVILLHSISHI